MPYRTGRMPVSVSCLILPEYSDGIAAERIEACVLEEVVVANTLPLPPNVVKTTRKVRQLSVGKLLAQVITCIHTGDSVSGMFDVKKAGVLLA